MKNNLSWEDALIYFDTYARTDALSPFSYEDIVHIGEASQHHKFTEFENAEDFFNTAIRWIDRSDDDNCAFNLPFNTCFVDGGCFLASELSTDGSKPTMSIENVYIDIKNDNHAAFDENVKYIKTVTKTS